MKNNKLLYLLTIFITLFTFNINANAAQELTCVYEKGNVEEKIILIQNSDSTREIWAHNKDVSIDSAGWEKKYTDNLKKLTLTQIDNNGALKSCPIYVNIIGDEAVFFDEKNTISNWDWDKVWPQELDESSSLDYVKRPPSTELENPENNDPINEGGLINIDDLDNSKYQAFCSYKKILENNEYHHIQLIYGKDSFGKTHIMFTEFDPQKGKNGQYSSMKNQNEVVMYPDENTCKDPKNSLICFPQIYTYNFDVSPNFTADYFINEYSGECPESLFVKRKWTRSDANNSFSLDTTILTEQDAQSPDNDINMYIIVSGLNGGTNPITGEEIAPNGVPNVEIQFEKINIENCADLVGEEIAGYFKVIWNLVKIGVPILLIALGTIDFTQATFAGKEDEMKKAQGKFIKRIIIAAIIYLVPTLIGFLLKIANSVWPNIGTDICGIIF